MSVSMIAVYVLIAIVVVEAVAIAVLWWRVTSRDEELAELQRRLDTRANLITGGREAVKSVWQTANILRREGLGAAVRSNIEDLAGRPSSAPISPGWRSTDGWPSRSPTSRDRPRSTNASVTGRGYD